MITPSIAFNGVTTLKNWEITTNVGMDGGTGVTTQKGWGTTTATGMNGETGVTTPSNKKGWVTTTAKGMDRETGVTTHKKVGEPRWLQRWIKKIG